MEKYKKYGILSKTTHFLSVFCEAGVVQQRTEAQAGMVQDGLMLFVTSLSLYITMLTFTVQTGPKITYDQAD